MTEQAKPMLHNEPDTSPVVHEARPWPLAARVCMWFSYAQVVASIIAWYIWGIGPYMDPVDQEEVRHFHRAKFMLLPAFLLESCYLISARSSARQLKLHGSEMSYLVILEYCVKMTCYFTMAHFNGGIVHVNLRAHGPVRACYTVRYLEWSIAVPTLLTINNYPLSGKQPFYIFAQRLFPNLFVTWAYILASWVAEVTPDPVVGWALVILSFVAYLAAIWDQVDVVLEADRGMSGLQFKILVVVLKEIVFFLYGLVYLLGIANIMSSAAEQMFYTYGDVMLKVVQASVLVIVRNWEGLAELQMALERKVETSKEDRRRLFHCANAPIFVITQECTIAAWNEHLEKVSGIREEDVVGKSILDLVEPGSRSGLKTAIDSCWGGSSSGAVEVMLQRQSPDQQPVQMLLALVEQLGTDSMKTITAIGQDLTEVAAMKAVNERKARFTAVLGHELRSPLHGIMGLSGSMASGTTNSMLKRQLSMIKGCAARLLDLVTNIMEMAKAEKMEESGGQKIDKRPVNIMDIVDEVIGMTEMAVDKNGRHLVGGNVIMVNNMCKGKLPMVVGDSYKITQLLYNLVTNAAKFTASGSIQISAREDRDHGMLEIDVTDTGKGIEPAALKRIFEPFQQTENKDSRSFQGIGLGLSVAMSIARLHGGEIRVASKCGQGSTFTVVLPCDFSKQAGLTLRAEDTVAAAKPAAAKAAASASQQMVVPRGGATAPAGQRPLALSVDDDDINQEVIEQTLGAEYRVVRAMNGMEAFEYLDSGKEFPSLMLLDVMMPGLSGFEVVKEIRNKRALTHTQLPVVMLSARSPQEATANEAFESGATDYMQKPFSANILKSRLSVINEVRQELRKAELGAVESYKQEVEKTQKAKDEKQQKQQPAPAQPPPPPQEKAPAPQPQPDPVEVAARNEAIKKLERECGDLKAKLEANDSEATKTSSELQRLTQDRDRLKSQIAAAMSAAVTKVVVEPAPEDSPVPVTLGGFSMTTMCADLDAAESKVSFYKAEVDHRDRQILELREKADRNKCEAYLQRERAEAIERELRFIRQLSGRFTMAM